MFKLEIRTGNEAFNDGTEGAYEVARLLRIVADALQRGTSGAPLFDANGNQCGRFDLRTRDGDEIER